MAPCARGCRGREGSLAWCSLAECGSPCPDLLPHPQQTEPGGFGGTGPCWSFPSAVRGGDTGPVSPWVTFSLGLVPGVPGSRTVGVQGRCCCSPGAQPVSLPTGGRAAPIGPTREVTPAGGLIRSEFGSPAILTYPSARLYCRWSHAGIWEGSDHPSHHLGSIKTFSQNL